MPGTTVLDRHILDSLDGFVIALRNLLNIVLRSRVFFLSSIYEHSTI